MSEIADQIYDEALAEHFSLQAERDMLERRCPDKARHRCQWVEDDAEDCGFERFRCLNCGEEYER